MKKLLNWIKYKLAVWNLSLETNRKRRQLQQINCWNLQNSIRLSRMYQEELKAIKEYYGQD